VLFSRHPYHECRQSICYSMRVWEVLIVACLEHPSTPSLPCCVQAAPFWQVRALDGYGLEDAALLCCLDFMRHTSQLVRGVLCHRFCSCRLHDDSNRSCARTVDCCLLSSLLR
jgi:hypothetical protein